MQTTENIGFDDKAFHFIRDFARHHAGLEISANKRPMVAGRLVKRLRRLQIETFEEYRRLLEADTLDEELVELINVLTTNHTKFFREDHHFDHLEKEVLAPIVTAGSAPARFRIWSAGCSRGHEPYTIALTLHMKIPNLPSWNVRILATDIDTQVLQKGRDGIYDGEEVASIPSGYRKKYLTLIDPQKDLWQMNRDVRNLIVFNRLNFMERWPFKGPFDVIFFRNVGIYFSKQTQLSLYQQFADMLKPGGWLYIGHSEKVPGLENRLKTRGKCIYQRIS